MINKNFCDSQTSREQASKLELEQLVKANQQTAHGVVNQLVNIYQNQPGGAPQTNVQKKSAKLSNQLSERYQTDMMPNHQRTRSDNPLGTGKVGEQHLGGPNTGAS